VVVLADELPTEPLDLLAELDLAVELPTDVDLAGDELAVETQAAHVCPGSVNLADELVFAEELPAVPVDLLAELDFTDELLTDEDLTEDELALETQAAHVCAGSVNLTEELVLTEEGEEELFAEDAEDHWPQVWPEAV